MDGSRSKQRTWHSNQFRQRGDSITVTAKQNGSNWCLLGGDASSAACHIMRGGSVKCNAAQVKGINMPKFALDNEEIKSKMDQIAASWGEVQKFIIEGKVAEMKRNGVAKALKKENLDLLKMREQLRVDLETEKISVSEYMEKDREISKKMYAINGSGSSD